MFAFWQATVESAKRKQARVLPKTRGRLGMRGARGILGVLVALLAPGGVLSAQSLGSQMAAGLVAAAVERTSHRVTYDGSYRRIPYPNGDVPAEVGVCTDVVIRSYRAIGVDLQREVHEDMNAAFQEYPANWGLDRPDPNIDHRRVANLQVFLKRQRAALSASDDPHDYEPGDLVTWMLPGNLPHIGIVVERYSGDGKRPLIVHNIGRGPKMEDILFAYDITGHFRYLPVPGTD
jgi:uncharacterized protein YijF (DUF1287 family)